MPVNRGHSIFVLAAMAAALPAIPHAQGAGGAHGDRRNESGTQLSPKAVAFATQRRIATENAFEGGAIGVVNELVIAG